MVHPLVSLAGQATTVHSVVFSDSLGVALSAIGDVHTEAAEKVLRQDRSQSNGREILNRVMAHLETAHIAYRRKWEGAWRKALRPVVYGRIIERDVYVCCLLATCHKALGDSDVVVRGYLEDAKRAFRHEGFDSVGGITILV